MNNSIKRPMLLAFLVIVGMACAAIFTPPSGSTLEGKQPAKISAVGNAGPQLAIQTARAPVPLPDLHRSSSLEMASRAETVPAARIAPGPLTPVARANLVLEPATEKEVGNLSDSHCAGRPMKSITVMADGNVHVQC
jgi:hypothetical protein